MSKKVLKQSTAFHGEFTRALAAAGAAAKLKPAAPLLMSNCRSSGALGSVRDGDNATAMGGTGDR